MKHDDAIREVSVELRRKAREALALSKREKDDALSAQAKGLAAGYDFAANLVNTKLRCR